MVVKIQLYCLEKKKSTQIKWFYNLFGWLVKKKHSLLKFDHIILCYKYIYFLLQLQRSVRLSYYFHCFFHSVKRMVKLSNDLLNNLLFESLCTGMSNICKIEIWKGKKLLFGEK